MSFKTSFANPAGKAVSNFTLSAKGHGLHPGKVANGSTFGSEDTPVYHI
jgi:hypothetical protein